MSWADLYRKKLVSANEAVKVIKSGDWVEYGEFAGQVQDLDKALAKRKDELKDIKVRAVTRAAAIEVVKADPTGEHFTYVNWHFSGLDRKLHDQGLCYFSPILFREVPRYYRENQQVDVTMITVTPMDKHGYFNYGLNNAATRASIEKAKTIVVEVNENMPRVLGGTEECIHISEVDFVVESSNWAIPALPVAKISETDEKIAKMIVNELQDGSCIQLGIGGMPNAVGKLIAQSDLKNLGVHTEMFVDAYMDMYLAGRVTGLNKSIDKGKMVFNFAMGSKTLYDFMDHNPVCASFPVDYTNVPHIIAQNDKVTSINNCIEIDLFGQVCSESAGVRQISGTGGQVDFFEGAYLSKGGKAFCCFTASYKDKEGNLKSRINPLLTTGAIVTTPRTVVQYVVTENGIVNLKGKSTWERAEALISLAHPDFYEQLVKDAEKMGIWRKSNKK